MYYITSEPSFYNISQQTSIMPFLRPILTSAHTIKYSEIEINHMCQTSLRTLEKSCLLHGRQLFMNCFSITLANARTQELM